MVVPRVRRPRTLQVPRMLLGVGRLCFPQGGSASPPGFLRRRGYEEQMAIVGRWDIVSNDPYGRSLGWTGFLTRSKFS